MTAKEHREKANYWAKTRDEWEKKLAARPNDPMTQVCAKSIIAIANSQEGTHRRQAAEKIGTKN